ncbi:MAG: HAMP domain-containing protein [Candidatus Omnitrophica bacterium]|nr:HAMP domain-containing protein [Candidatus Omnitrophota bacterium]
MAKINSIGVKSILWLCFFLLSVFSTSTVINIRAQSKILLERQEASARSLGEVILTAMRYPMLRGEQDIIQRQFDAYCALGELEVIHLMDSEGVIRRTTDKKLLGQKTQSELILRDNQSDYKSVCGLERRQRSGRLVFSQIQPIFNQPQCYSCHGPGQKLLGKLRIAFDWGPEKRAQQMMQNTNIAVSLGSLLLLSIFTGVFLFKVIIAPLGVLESGMNQVSNGDFSGHCVLKSNDEIGALTKKFNDMSLALNRAMLEERKSRETAEHQSKELGESFSLLNATLESSNDGVLVVDTRRQITIFNRRVIKLWAVPEEFLRAADDRKFFEYCAQQLIAPESFMKKIAAVYADAAAQIIDILRFKDGRVYEWETVPQVMNGEVIGRIWRFRDKSANFRVQEELRVKMEALERFNKFIVGRELYMRALKEKVDELEKKINPPKA